MIPVLALPVGHLCMRGLGRAELLERARDPCLGALIGPQSFLKVPRGGVLRRMAIFTATPKVLRASTQRFHWTSTSASATGTSSSD